MGYFLLEWVDPKIFCSMFYQWYMI